MSHCDLWIFDLAKNLPGIQTNIEVCKADILKGDILRLGTKFHEILESMVTYD